MASECREEQRKSFLGLTVPEVDGRNVAQELEVVSNDSISEPFEQRGNTSSCEVAVTAKTVEHRAIEVDGPPVDVDRLGGGPVDECGGAGHASPADPCPHDVRADEQHVVAVDLPTLGDCEPGWPALSMSSALPPVTNSRS